jgi:glutaredoxin
MTFVPGENKKHKVKLYALSTCGWCRKTKDLLKSLNQEYEYQDMDQISGDEYDRVREEVKKFNPRLNFPTIVVDDGKEVIVGFREDEIRRCLIDD